MRYRTDGDVRLRLELRRPVRERERTAWMFGGFLIGCRDFVDGGLAVMGSHSGVVLVDPLPGWCFALFFQSLFGKNGESGNRSIL